MAYFHNISGVHRDGKAEIVIGLKENAFSIGYGSNASEIEFRAKDGSLLDISFPALQSLSTDILNTLKGDTSYVYPWLYAPKSALPNSLVIYGDKPNKANTTPILAEDVVCYDRSGDPTGTLSTGKVLSFNGTSNQLVSSSVTVDKIASFKDPILPGNFAMSCGNNELCDSLVSKDNFANKVDRGTTLAHYGIDDAYTRNQVDGQISGMTDLITDLTNGLGQRIDGVYTKTEVDAADAKLKGEISALTTVVNDTVSRTNDSIHYKGTVASFSALTPQMQVFGDVYTVLSSGGTDSGGCKIYAKDNVCYTHAGWICLGGGGKFDITETFPTLPTTNKTILGSIQEVFTSASDGKKLIAESITGKGVVTESTATYDIMANNIRNIHTPTESKTVTPTAAGFNVVPAPGKHLNMVTVNGDPDLISGNIRSGVNIFGIVGNASIVNTSDANATAAQILKGQTAYVNGTKITGTIPSRSAMTYTPSTANQILSSGQYLSGAITVLGDTDLISGNIRSGINLFGVAGSPNVVDTTAGTAAASQILAGAKAWVKGSMITGTMANLDNSKVTASQTSDDSQFVILTTSSSGYHASGFRIESSHSNIAGVIALTPQKLLKGNTVCGVVGTATGDANATAGQILKGQTAYVNGLKVTGTIPSKPATTYTPSTGNQTIPSGQYLSGAITIQGDADLVSGNIRSGINLFGIAGNSNVVDTTAGTATAAQMLKGAKAWVKGSMIAGTIPSKAATNYTPSTANQTIASGMYLSGTQTIKGDLNLIPANIKEGVTLFNTKGTSRPVECPSNCPARVYVNSPLETHGYIDVRKIELSGSLTNGAGMTPSLVQGTPVCVRGTQYYNYIVTDKGYFLTVKGVFIQSEYKFSNAESSTVSALAVEPDGSYVYASHGNLIRCYNAKNELCWEKTIGDSIDKLIVCGDSLCVCASGVSWHIAHAKTGIPWCSRNISGVPCKFAGYGNYFVWCPTNESGRPINILKITDDANMKSISSTIPSQHASDITDVATDAYGNVYVISRDGMLTRRPLSGDTTIAWSYMNDVRSDSISVDLLGNVYLIQTNNYLARVLPNGTLHNIVSAGGTNCIEVSVTNQFKILIASRDRYMWTYSQSFTIQQG